MIRSQVDSRGTRVTSVDDLNRLIKASPTYQVREDVLTLVTVDDHWRSIIYHHGHDA